jgi:transcriptional regulator with XRE-family HTH domain
MSRLQDRRKAKGLSQSQLAKASGVNLRMIQKYEIGGAQINGAALIKGKALADALGCLIEDLIEPAE